MKLLTVLFLIHSCASSNDLANKKKETPKIVFLTYNIKKNTEKETEIIFEKLKIVNGKIKGFSNNNQNQTMGDLECSFLDKNKNILQIVHIKNPLKKLVEFVNNSGNLEKKIFEMDSTQFVIRAPYFANTRFIEISEKTSGKTLKKIITTKL
ncbi:hypothetical protein [Xanthomarina sp. GH4-25]|uniref:hypothetical protein n=1 Tax=Xanthomarina sp. GH4-25 TaxID=3349335 RepID=UPI003877A446